MRTTALSIDVRNSLVATAKIHIKCPGTFPHLPAIKLNQSHSNPAVDLITDHEDLRRTNMMNSTPSRDSKGEESCTRFQNHKQNASILRTDPKL